MRRLAQAALVVLTGFLASRILGVVRSIVIAAHFGTGTEASAYVAAIAVPDTVFQVLVGGAVGSAFIPVFQRLLAGPGRRCLADDQFGDQPGRACRGGYGTGAGDFRAASDGRPGRWPRPEFRELAANLSRILLITPAIFAASTFCASVLNSVPPLRGRRACAAHVQPGDHRRRVLPERAIRHSGPGHRRRGGRGPAPARSGTGADSAGDALATDRRSAQQRRARGGAAVRAAGARARRSPVQQSPLGSAVRVVPDHRQHGLPRLCVADDHDAAGAGDGHRHRGLPDAVRGQRARSSRTTPAGLSSVAAHDPVSDHSGQHRAHGAG